MAAASFQHDGRLPGSAAGWANALGWFSVGIGLAELLMPRRVARAAGLAEQTRTLRALGLRELASGIGILLRPNKPGWLWSRVAGDALDLGLLTNARTREGGRRVRGR